MTLAIAEHAGYLIAIASLFAVLWLRRDRGTDDRIRRMISQVTTATTIELELRQLLAEAGRVLQAHGHTDDAIGLAMRAAGVGSERYIAREITR